MASKKATADEKVIVTDDAPVVEPTKPAAKAKQEPALSLDRQQVIAALNAGNEA
jgi:hypothetical protein